MIVWADRIGHPKADNPSALCPFINGYDNRDIVMLTQKEIRHMFSYNRHTGILRWKNPLPNSHNIKIGDEAGYINSEGYRKVMIDGRYYPASHIIWCGEHGYWSENIIDHKDRIRDNNRIKNLREVSRQCNNRNTCIAKNNTSGIKGVTFHKASSKWLAQIIVNKKMGYLGVYPDFDDAVCARLAAEQCLNWHGCDTDSSAFSYVRDNILKMPAMAQT
jgi:hypothetical protein